MELTTWSTMANLEEDSATVATSSIDDAFDDVMRSYQRDVFRTILSIVHDEMVADQLTQDTFVRAWKKRKSYRGDGEILHWLLRIGVNAARDELRRSRRWINLSSIMEPGFASKLRDAHPTPDRLAESRDISETIRKTLDELSVRQRLVFTLHHYEGHTLEEIARLTGIRPSTARVHLHRATSRLREALAPLKGAKR